MLSPQGSTVWGKANQLPIQEKSYINNGLYTAGMFGDEFHYEKEEDYGFTSFSQNWQVLFKRQVFLKVCKSSFSLDGIHSPEFF